MGYRPGMPPHIATIDLALSGKGRAKADYAHFLPGNHDLMVVDAIKSEDAFEHWLANGGKTVLADVALSRTDTLWSEIVERVKRAVDPSYLDHITNGPTHLYLGDLIFVHGGPHPHRDRTTFLTQDRHFARSDDHWAALRYPFLDWTGGWDADDLDPACKQTKPTVVVHGHSPALRQKLAHADDLTVCDAIDVYRAVDLDIGAGHRPQLAWAHFRIDNGQDSVNRSFYTASAESGRTLQRGKGV